MGRRIHVIAAVSAVLVVAAACSSSGSGGAPGNSSSAPSSRASSSSSSAGRGSDNSALSAKELVTSAISAMTSAASMHVTGEGPAPTFERLDLHLGPSKAAGTLTDFEDRKKIVRFRVINDTAYVLAPDSAYRNLATGAQRERILALVHGKWVKGSIGSSLWASVEMYSSKQRFLSSNLKKLTSASDWTKGAPETDNGVATATVTCPDGTLYVAKSGTAYPVEFRTTDGGYSFGSWNEPFSVSAPPSAQVVDLSKLPQ